MARPKKELYTSEEVELITHYIMAGAMAGTNNMLLNSGAAPSKEIGEIVMHLAGGVVANNSAIVEMVKSLQLDETRLKQLQEIANGAFK